MHRYSSCQICHASQVSSKPKREVLWTHTHTSVDNFSLRDERRRMIHDTLEFPLCFMKSDDTQRMQNSTRILSYLTSWHWGSSECEGLPGPRGRRVPCRGRQSGRLRPQMETPPLLWVHPVGYCCGGLRLFAFSEKYDGGRAFCHCDTFLHFKISHFLIWKMLRNTCVNRGYRNYSPACTEKECKTRVQNALKLLL